MNMKNGLHLQEVSISFSGRQIISGANLMVAPQQIVALLGPSGSGKSSLLRVIAGLDEPTQGSVFWNEQDLKNVSPHKRGFGYMFQDGQLFTQKNVFENIAYGLKIQKMPKFKRQETVTKLLETVGLPGYEKRQVATLSGGESQRVALARSLAPEPQLLLLDEPLSSLDTDLRTRLAKDLARILRETKMTAVLVTHDRHEAETIADQIVLLRDGKLELE